jgi:cell division protein FtsZ
LGAKNILLNISSAKGAHELLMDEFEAISNYIQEESGNKAEMIIGTSYDENLGESIAITLVATGFESGKYENKLIEIEPVQAVQKPIVMPLINEVDAPVANANSVDEAVIDTPQDQDISMLAPETIVEDAPVEQINHFLFEAELTEEFNAEASIEFEINPQSNENITNELINESEIDFQDNADLSEIPQEQLVNPVAFSQDDLPLPQAPNAAADKKDFFIQPSLLDFHEDPFFEEAERKIEKQISRIKELKELNLNIHSSQGLRDLEKEPAYKRRQKRLDEIPHSSASQVSRLSLFEDGSGKPELKSNNSFLHDNVD